MPCGSTPPENNEHVEENTMKIRASLLAALVAATTVFSLQAHGGEAPLLKPFRYYRFSITKITGTSIFQLSEIALYDASGNRINLNLTNMDNVRNNDWVTRLSAPNTCTLLENGSSGVATTHNDALQNLFDGNLGTKSFASGCGNLNENNPSTWPGIIMRLADDAPAVASYNIATANDNVWAEGTGNGRTVTGWALFGSHDGVAWMQIARQTSPSPYVPNPILNQTWYNGGDSIPISDYSGVAVFVPSGDALTVNSDLGLGTVVNHGVVSVSSGATAQWDVATGETVKLPGGALAGSGMVEKTGAGELRAGGDNGAFAGTIAAKGGTLRFVQTASPTAFTYYRFCFKGKNGGNPGEQFELSELALYDAAGNRINLNLSNVGVNASGNLVAGSFSFVNNGASAWVREAGHNEAPEKIFDGSVWTKMYAGMKPTASSYPYIAMRLAEGAAPVAAYNLATGNDTVTNPNRLLVSWSLDGSMDGTSWVTLDSVTDDPHASTANSSWFNGGIARPVFVEVMPRKARYYRLSITGLQQCGGYEGLQMDEIAVFDANGNRLNLDAAYQGDNLAASALNANSFTCILNNHGTGGSSEKPGKLTDGSTSTKAYFSGSTFNATDKALRIVMRLADDAPPVAGYNICSGTDDNWAWGANRCRTAGSWTLEASDDGTTWILLDEEVDSAKATHADNTWFNGGNMIHCTQNGNGGASMPTNATLTVSNGATMVFPVEQGGTVKSLEIDCTAAAGTFANFSAADGMTINLVNFRAFRDASVAGGKLLPVLFSGATDFATEDSWKVLIDGDARKGADYKVFVRNGGLYVKGSPATLLYVR